MDGSQFPKTPWQIARENNLARMQSYVSANKGDPERARKAAANVRRQLGLLSQWAAQDDDTPAPTGLAGLTAFDLSDAADALEAAALQHREVA